VTVLPGGVALVLNCGSSSVKYQVVDTIQAEPLASGLIERVTDHTEAIEAIIESLAAPGSGVSLDDLTVVGHRVVQGGSEFSAPTIITDDVERHIALLSTLAPLHNPPNLAGIAAARVAFPLLPHVAVFDTAFHHTLPEAAYTYASIDAWPRPMGSGGTASTEPRTRMSHARPRAPWAATFASST
jgi:acetate kinase